MYTGTDDGLDNCDKIIIPDYNNHQAQVTFYSRLYNMLYLRHMHHVTAPCYRASFLTDNARGTYHPKDIPREA
jgi:hypothetical protein